MFIVLPKSSKNGLRRNIPVSSHICLSEVEVRTCFELLRVCSLCPNSN